MRLALTCVLTCLLAVGADSSWAEDGSSAQYPRYKPSSRSPEALDIRTDAYGASRDAPDALGIGALVPDFTVPRAGGGSIVLSDALAQGPVVLIFYRGHW